MRRPSLLFSWSGSWHLLRHSQPADRYHEAGHRQWCGGPARGNASWWETPPGIRRPTRDPSWPRPPRDVPPSRQRSASEPLAKADKPSCPGCTAGSGFPRWSPRLSGSGGYRRPRCLAGRLPQDPLREAGCPSLTMRGRSDWYSRECRSWWPWFASGVGPGRIRWRGGPHTGSESAARGQAVWPYRTPRRCFQPCRKRRRRQSPQRHGNSCWRWAHTQGDPLGQIGRRACGSRAVQSQAVFETGCRRQARLQHLQFQSHPCFQPRRESYPRSGHPIGQCPGTRNYSFPGQFSRDPGSSGTHWSRQ